DEAIGRFDTAAGEHEFTGQKTMTLVAAAEQHFRHVSGAVNQDQRCGIARLKIRKRLIAHAAREPLGAGCGGPAPADARSVVPQQLSSLAAATAVPTARGF